MYNYNFYYNLIINTYFDIVVNYKLYREYVLPKCIYFSLLNLLQP